MKKGILLILACLVYVSIFSQENMENNAKYCSDGIDNDGDGLIDCQDNECYDLVKDNCNESQYCYAISPCEFCAGNSYVDTIITYLPACQNHEVIMKNLSNPTVILYAADYAGVLSLGDGGYVVLGFTNILLINSGDFEEDLYIFEGGTPEGCEVFLRPANAETDALCSGYLGAADSMGFYFIGNIGGAISSLDIDRLFPNLQTTLMFDQVKIVDNGRNATCDSEIAPGADIDAVCAISFIPIPIDCQGTQNGTAVMDECGECLEPTDSSFNDCIDCAGIPNGTAIIDDCGICLESADPNFNNCKDKYQVYIPNSFSPNEDGINEVFKLYVSNEVNARINKYLIFDRWGELLFQSNNFDVTSNISWWNGEFQGEKMQSGVYVYYVEIEFQNGEIKDFGGDISIVK